MRRKEYDFTVIEYQYGTEAWKHQTNDIKKAYKWLYDGICDGSGAMYMCYWDGTYEREAYDKDGKRIEIEHIYNEYIPY